MVDSVLAAGVAGIQRGISNAQDAAQRIAGATTSDPLENEAVGNEQASTESVSATDATGGLNDLTEGAVQLVQSEQQVQASAAVVRTADETLGTLIDTLA